MISDRVQRLLEGDRRALTRVLTAVENGGSEGREALRALFPKSGRAHVIGVTGPTGSGKSTLVGALVRVLRERGKTVGVVAVDPTSPFTHGAILGDRIRMQDLTADPGVFIRSMATRGALGGLAAATADVVTVFDAAGMDVVIVETVGAGQDEVEVADTAETTVVVNIPGAGDDMQAIKAGILEIADVLVVNKSDLPQAESVFKQLHIFTDLQRQAGWDVPIIKTVAHKDEGAAELADAIEQHRQYIVDSGRVEEMSRQRAHRQLLAVAQATLVEDVLAGGGDLVDELVEQIARREIDPRTAADKLIEAAKG